MNKKKMLYKTLWKKGEEITDGYSGIFCNVPQDQRSQNHTRYHFDCLCKGGIISEYIAPTYLLLPLGKRGSKWGDFHWAMGCV